jgi:hypothetical protein
MKIENETQTLLEKYKDKLELVKTIANLSVDEKQCLFNQDLQEVFDNIKGYEKGTQGHNYKYADLSEVHKVIKEACKNKVFFYHIETITSLKTIICHSLTGLKIEVESEKPSMEKMISLNNRVNFMQAFGSWQTYTKRYHLLALFGVAEEDNDAEELTQDKKEKKLFTPVKAPVEPVKTIDAETEKKARLLAKEGEATFKDWFSKLPIEKQNLFSLEFKKELASEFKKELVLNNDDESAKKISKIFIPSKAPVE